MPKLGQYDYLLDIVFFLYPSEDAAKRGKEAGGSGFLVSVPSATYPSQYHHIYAVTNWHVACQGSPVIRVNSAAGGAPIIFPYEVHEWTFIPNSHDVAVIRIDLNPSIHRVEAINFDSFALTSRDISDNQINAGEDAFMLGRFIDFDGREVNVPSMRFGNISIMRVTEKQPTGFIGQSHVIDMHSRTGFSGSPVFVYRTTGSIFSDAASLIGGGHMMRLLGILWGQYPEEWTIGERRNKQAEAGALAAEQPKVVLDGKSVKGWSGMSLVAPAEAIGAVLNLPRLKAERDAIDAKLHERFGGSPEAMG
jgi:hypothetical protein